MSLLPARVTGHPVRWARDFAVIGVVTGGGAPFSVLSWVPAVDDPVAFCAVAAVIGGLAGAALGMPPVVDALQGCVRIPWLILAGAPIGAAWGALAGGAAAVATGATNSHLGSVRTVAFGCGAVAGAAQFGLIWFPYTFQTVRRGATWPVVVAACAVAPLLGLFSAIATLIAWAGV